MSGFIIRHQNLTLELGLTDLYSLKLHEETLEKPLRSLVMDISEKGVMKHPVIVDSNSLTILDGMHRVQALKIIGCVRALTCRLDYQNPKVGVKFWFRALNDIEMDVAEKIIKEMKIPAQRGVFNDRILSSPNLILALVSKDRSIISEKSGRTVEEAYSIIKALQNRLERVGEISYCFEDEALYKASKGEVNAVLAMPKLTKMKIVELASKGYLLPPKTTRHIIPARPLGVNAPLDLLMNEKLQVEEANSTLAESLKGKRIRRFGPRALYEGRFYEEELYVFQ